MVDARTCPDEIELLNLARGTISPERGATLRDHIGDCSACRAVVASLASTPAESAAPGAEGADLSRYELQRLLGTGGMGEVFLARDRVLGRLVALKLLHEDGASADPEALERVSREARALASLADPNVVAVYDRGVLDGRPFLAMEYVRGRTLRQWVATDRPDLPRLVDVLIQTGRGLMAAHEIGVVHRDFKPDNVLVGDDGRARVTDFGLARASSGAEAPEAVSMDQVLDPIATHGVFAGTPAYAAPERLTGAAADARSDQYAFCVTAYEAIHGRRPPHEPGHGPRASPVDRRIRRIDAVLERGLSPDPAHRFASMGDVLRELEACMQPRGPGRRRLLLAGAAIAASAALAGVLLARRDAERVALPSGLHAPCGGTSGGCQSPLVCKYRDSNACGVSGSAGTCGWPSDGCDAKSPSVCGCNGVSYDNQCKANLEGAAVAHRGACVTCSTAESCADVTTGTGKRAPAFCHFSASATGDAARAAQGVCWPRPASCASTGPRVCGQDGETYESLCEARRSGIDVEREGPCTDDAGAMPPFELPAPSPIAPGGLAFGAPDEQGMDARPLIALASWIEREKLPIFSILVSRNGVLVLELYTSSMTRDHANYLMGTTTALTSALIGAAMDRGLIGGPETPVADALPAAVFPDAATRERFRSVTIQDVLGMSALDAPVPPRDNSDASRERARRLMASHNRTRLALAQPLLPHPGASIQYTDFTPQIATGILEYAARQSAFELAETWLFGPLGFRNYEWLYQDASGIDDGAAGLRLRPIDLHKLGVLYLRRGVWEGQRLLSSEWIERSFTPWIRSSDRVAEPNYGGYWYTIDFTKAVPAGTQRAERTGAWVAHVAQGWKGQRLAVFVDQGLVVSMTAVIEAPEDETEIFRRIIGDYVAPAIEGAGAEPPHPDPALRGDLAAVVDRLQAEPLLHTEDLEPRLVPSLEPRGRHHPFQAN